MVAFHTERLLIRDHRPEDLADLHRLLADEKAMRYLPEIHDKTWEGTLQNLQEALRENEEPHRRKWFFAMVDHASVAYIGEIGYTVHEDSPVGKVVQLGYFIRPEYWGKGLVTEAASIGSLHK